jgi:hypothetical protein
MDWSAGGGSGADLGARPKLSRPQSRSTYDVRAAIRQRIARRDLIMNWSVIAAVLGAVLCGAYLWFSLRSW